jgi:hypothetical protein
MPFFKTTKNILVDHGEYFDPNWMDSDELVLPPKQDWPYDREIKIDDVDIWEVIGEWGNVGIYAAWHPYAEFYIIKPNYTLTAAGYLIEEFYGPRASQRLTQRAKHFGVDLKQNKIWVDADKTWLY